ncbi:DNA primase [Leifsonia sp. 98AMF]|uniref:DNA primase n=1 Tax=unclassified Leifsonia TaxID=2663824 RepID=UPI00087AE631|nr:MULTISPECIES: DNA primase [unclassified Leifsonia]SDH32536.1 DNA primase [Leifsonia sp. 197AMF]SDJ02343.1 DNA primase [Leifsonia sp. 466MF]SDJ70934.1 DNA primase [Leifsonia sp. 157MF]SDO06072.1 DNA primase [Leifsonia sp. 509MF]SEM97923.1 DNA primase [Leifsonia sp. 467MF]
MAGRIRQSDIEEVKARTNIGDIVGDYVSLKTGGVGALKGLCPFHDEKSPSFYVRPGVGRYHCFGCGEGGDVYEFLLKMDHVSFTDAVERLAARIGYQLHYEEGGGGPSESSGNRARLLAANAAAEEFFRDRLSAPDADPGRRFLGERGFDAAAAAHFGVGFAPKSWDELTKHLRGKGFSQEELLTAGLVSQGDRGVYDRFRGRLIWPIRDVTGQTIGFGARRLLDDDKGPKYLNTPETPVYKKAQVLYGLDLAKRDISRQDQVVVVEGYTDVMACHLAGITTAVATCGTSFGVDHIKVIRRVMGDDNSQGSVIFTFDPDAAGQKAASRAFGEEQRFSAQTYVAVGPDGLDPCDLRLAQGDVAVRRMIDARKPMFEFMIRRTVERFDLDSVEGRAAALRAGAPIVATIRDPASQNGYTRELARLSGADLQDAIRAVRAAQRGSGSREGSRDGSRDDGRTRSYPGGDGQSGSAEQPRPLAQADLADPTQRTERESLMVLLQLPGEVGQERAARAVQVPFVNPTHAVVRDAIASQLATLQQPGWVDRVLAEVPQAYAPTVNALAVAELPQGGDPGRYARSIVDGLIDRDLLREKAELTSRLGRTEDPELRRQISLAMVAIESERRRLRGE